MSAGDSKIGTTEQINDLLYEEDLQGDLEEKVRVVVNLKKFQENGGDIATLIKYIPKNIEVIIGETERIFFIGHIINHYEHRNTAEFKVYNRDGNPEYFTINVNAIEEIFKLARMENNSEKPKNQKNESKGTIGGRRKKRTRKKRKKRKTRSKTTRKKKKKKKKKGKRKPN